jgi:hypothetical protein
MKQIDEKKIQQQCWIWLSKTHKELIMHSVVNGFGVTIPNSIPNIYHNKIRQMVAMAVDVLKMTGMTEGVSDTMIHGMNGKVIWCEFKTAIGKQRNAQIRLQSKVQGNGGVYIMPRNLEQFMQEIDKHYKWLTT